MGALDGAVVTEVETSRLPLYEEQERERARRQLLDAGFTAWPVHGVAPDWACRLSYLQQCGAAHFDRLSWVSIWCRAARDPAWVQAFLAVDILERERAKEIPGNAGSEYETGKRLAKWLSKSTTRKRKHA